MELLEHRMNEVKNLTSIAATKSTAVSQEAIDLLILDLALPPVDIEQLRNQVEDVNNEVNLNYYKYYYLRKIIQISIVKYVVGITIERTSTIAVRSE